MVGNSNCRWHWRDSGHTRGAPDPEPEIPWCGLMWPDCTPVSLAEAEAIRRYAERGGYLPDMGLQFRIVLLP